jgi:hypothetical protein
LLASFCATKEFIIDPGTTKALAAWKAMELSHRLGLRKIVLEGDFLKVVNDLKQESVPLGVVRAYNARCKDDAAPAARMEG